jgi:D-alanyl-D-alanine carboxypeptidase/D-alanyl-D-alanine-endopeptidase (penicillin-binding protein 4)
LLVLVAIAAVPALAMVGLWQLAEARAKQGIPPVLAEAETPTASGTAVLSVRRAPATLSVDAALPALAFQLDPVIAQIDDQSCLMVSAAGRTVASAGADRALVPASNVKIVTGAVALDVIGPEFRYVTELRGTIEGDTVQGNLYFVGGGDPLLAVESYPATQRFAPEPRTPLESLVDQLVAAGVTNITGGIVGVETRYDDERYVDTWGDGIRGTEAGPLGALLVNDGVVTGEPLKPGDPAAAAALELGRLLNAAGITATAFPTSGLVDAEAPVIASVESAPFTDVLAEMLTNSDNNTAELVLKEIAVQANRPGTRLDGLAVVDEKLREWDIPMDGVVLVDGSGLDRGNRLTCRALLEVLHREDLDGPFGDGLAVAGETGTMAPYFEGSPLDGVLRAKTGTLTGAKAFSGFVPAAGGVELAFSLILNGEATLQCGNAQCPPFDALARALATFPGGAPDAATVAPVP